MYSLRFEEKQTEYRAILSYHLFQTIAYFTAYFNGLIAMQSIRTSLVVMLVLYVVGTICLATGLLAFQPGDTIMPYIIPMFGLGHGALKSAIIKMMKVNLIGKGYTITSGLILFFEVVCVAVLTATDRWFVAKYTIIGFLFVVFILLLIATIGSFFDNHDTDDHKLFLIVRATAYGLANILVTLEKKAEEALKRRPMWKGKHPKSKPKRIQIEIIRPHVHWLNEAKKLYPEDLIADLRQKYRLHKFYWTIAGLWVAVEMKYSYWIINTYFTNRVLDDDNSLVVQPGQYIALTPLIFFTFAPLFYLIVRPIFSKSFYNTAIRQMCLGAFIVTFACGLGWKLSALQWELTTEFMAADDR